MNFLSLSWKSFFLLCLFWVIPVIGWYASDYVEKQWEQSLFQDNKLLAKNYHGVLQKLLQEDETFVRQFIQSESPNEVVMSKRQGPILIDGYDDEWYSYNNQLIARNHQEASKITLIEDEHFVYGLVQINDNQLVYRKNSYSSQLNDMLRLDLGYGYWLFRAIAPGAIPVQKEFGNGFRTVNSVLAVWQETKTGYAIEFRAPKMMVGAKISAVLYDVDDKTKGNFQEKYQGVFTFTDFSYFPLKRENDNSWLKSNELAQKQITVINSSGQVILQVGNLFPKSSYQDDYKGVNRLNNPFTREVISAGSSGFSEAQSSPQFIARFGYSLSNDGQTLGAVIVEGTLEKEKKSLANFSWISVSIFGFIWLVLTTVIVKQLNRYRNRVFLLNELTEQANETDAEEVDLSNIEIQSDDEVGQLSYNLKYYNERLGQRRDHQKKLLARLNHELRTPLAIIGSSLDNLELANLDSDELELIKNARSGQKRLSLSFNRLSEANRLEESLDKVPLDWFDLKKLLEVLINSYKNNWPLNKFEFLSKLEKCSVYGSEDLFAQMLDKIISNAIDFSLAEEAIEIELKFEQGNLTLTVFNKGPLIEKEKLKSIFNLMESSRTNSNHSNLGLGLYVAKLISRKHKIHISAKNIEKNKESGVQIYMLWKKKSYVVLT